MLDQTISNHTKHVGVLKISLGLIRALKHASEAVKHIIMLNRKPIKFLGLATIHLGQLGLYHAF